MTQTPVLKGNALCMASMLIWATAFPSADILLRIMGPLPLTAFRITVAAVFLLALWAAREGLPAFRGVPWLKAIAIGGVGFSIGANLLVGAQSLSDAVTIAILSAMMPLVGIALEVVLDGRKLTLPLVLGLVLTLAGGAVATQASSGPQFGWGAVLAIGSLFTYTWASRQTVKSLPGVSVLGQTASTLTGAALLAIVIALLAVPFGWSDVAWQMIGISDVLALLVYGVGSLAVSHLLWIAGVRYLGVGIASMHINAAPFYVMVFMLALGSSWNGMQALGALIVGIGVLVSQWKQPET